MFYFTTAEQQIQASSESKVYFEDDSAATVLLQSCIYNRLARCFLANVPGKATDQITIVHIPL